MSKLDLSHFYDIAEGNQEFVAKLMRVLQKNLQEYPPQMDSLFEKKAMVALRELAHKFKSCTAYTGAHEFNEILVDIESSEAKNMSNEQIAQLLKALQTQAQDLAQEVNQWLKNNT